MNTEEIYYFLKRRWGDRFHGVFSCDELPAIPSLMVCNTDPKSKPGTHWIAIGADTYGRGEYFDSFGRPPMETFRRYLDKHFRSWTFNRRQLQSILSSFCGHYCCLYCTLSCRGVNLKVIVAEFTNDTSFNDVFVHSFVCRNK